jgi:hypothetical protein
VGRFYHFRAALAGPTAVFLAFLAALWELLAKTAFFRTQILCVFSVFLSFVCLLFVVCLGFVCYSFVFLCK